MKLILYCSLIERYVQSLNMKIKSQDEFEVLRKLNKDIQPFKEKWLNNLASV